MPQALDTLMRKTIAGKSTHEAYLCLHHGRSSTSYNKALRRDGVPATVDDRFLIASTSKLFGTAMILSLQGRGKLNLDDPISRYFAPAEIDGLHIYRGVDYTSMLTLRHLLAHTSGLPDYFEEKRRHKPSLWQSLMDGADFAYDLHDVVDWSRDELTPHFAPGSGRRAFYSDTNFYLIGEIIARASGLALHEALKTMITGPLGLSNTLFMTGGIGHAPLRLGETILHCPKAIASMPVDGGMVSSAADLNRFGRAFFGGALFPSTSLDGLYDWRRVFFPLLSGTGLLRFKIPAIFSLLGRQPDLIGHSGISGAFLFHDPASTITVSGTINQMQSRSAPYRFMMKAVQIMQKAVA